MLLTNQSRYSCLSFMGGVLGGLDGRANRHGWALANRRAWDNGAYTSYPPGYQGGALKLAVSGGGIAARASGTGALAPVLTGVGDVAATLAGAGTLTGAITGLKDAATTITGTGALAVAITATADLECEISIGAVPSADDNFYALLDNPNAVDGLTVRQTLRIIAAALAGKVSGAAGNAPVFRAIDDSKDRISATTDASGNRPTVTVNGD